MLLLSLPVLAAFPMPTYPECGTPDRPDLCPEDLGQDWALLSYVPIDWKAFIREEEWELGTGIGADRAWRSTAGRVDVVIAVLDSGIMWDDSSLPKKHYLNPGELPFPQRGDIPGTVYDLNGDGVFNIDDWAEDPRVDWASGQDFADTMLDPSDLIATFSDSIDDDGNGYLDDISGWDFYENDNDPYDDTRFDHGTYEAQESMRPGEDGQGIGVCPNCMAMSLRVGDSFVAEGEAFGLAVLYATDNGAAIIQEALGTYSNSSLTQEAMQYAWEHDVLVIASAADETAYHPNAPGINPHAIYVHAITHSDTDENRSYLAYSNCTNHGARLDASATSTGCSSGATAITAGTAGLLVSAARDVGLSLSAPELFFLLVNEADDIAINSDNSDPTIYPTYPGWDRMSGAGRINAWRSVEEVVAGKIPPVAFIESPGWYQYVDPEVSDTLDVEGVVSARAGVQSWVLKAGFGLEPEELVTVASGTSAAEGLLGSIELKNIAGLDPELRPADYAPGTNQIGREDAVNQWTLSIRLEVTDSTGKTSMGRKVVHVHRDPDLLPGFPLQTGASLESSPKVVDLNGDGKAEILIVDSDGKVHAFQSDGTELPGWPASLELLEEVDPALDNHLNAPAWTVLDTERRSTAVATPAIADTDGDGAPEVFVASARGQLWCFEPDATACSGFPVSPDPALPDNPDAIIEDGFLGSPSLGDLDGDGRLEVAIGGMDGKVYAYKQSGERLSGFPVSLVYPGSEKLARITVGLAIGDLNGDGKDDIVVPTNEVLDDEHTALYAISGTGEFLPGWPVRVWGLMVDALPLVGTGFHGPVVLLDLDKDGSLEIFGAALAGDFNIWKADGSVVDSLPYARSVYGEGSNVSDPSFIPLMTIPAVGDLDGDGVPDLIAPGSGIDYATGMENDGTRTDFDHTLAVWSGASGELLSGFPRQLEDLGFLISPIAVDLDADGLQEAIMGSGGFMVHAWNKDGKEPSGWPKFTGQWVMSSPAVGDVDGDGRLELVVGTRSGGVFAWKTTTEVGGSAGWLSKGHDDRNTHNYETELTGYNISKNSAEEEKGCKGCSGSASGFLWNLLPGIVVLRFRRSRS
jgi:hypothetical protein